MFGKISLWFAGRCCKEGVLQIGLRIIRATICKKSGQFSRVAMVSFFRCGANSGGCCSEEILAEKLGC